MTCQTHSGTAQGTFSTWNCARIAKGFDRGKQMASHAGQVSEIHAGASVPPDHATIQTQLDRLLASPHLRHSKRCQALLTYVVEAYLDGSLDKVKERTIGFEVFHRAPGYDTNEDSVV